MIGGTSGNRNPLRTPKKSMTTVCCSVSLLLRQFLRGFCYPDQKIIFFCSPGKTHMHTGQETARNLTERTEIFSGICTPPFRKQACKRNLPDHRRFRPDIVRRNFPDTLFTGDPPEYQYLFHLLNSAPILKHSCRSSGNCFS